MSTATGIRILVAEDDPAFSELIEQRLLPPIVAAIPNSTVIFVRSIEAVLAELASIARPDVLLLDLTMPPSGMADTLARLDTIEQATPVVILTGSKEEAVRNIIGTRPTPVVEKEIAIGNPGLLHQVICRVIEFWQNTRHARTRENIRIMKAALHAPEG